MTLLAIYEVKNSVKESVVQRLVCKKFLITVKTTAIICRISEDRELITEVKTHLRNRLYYRLCPKVYMESSFHGRHLILLPEWFVAP